MAHLKVIVVLALLGLVLAAPSARVDLKLKSTLAHSKANIFISMRGSTDAPLASVHLQKFSGRAQRLNTVAQTLRNHAATSQKTVLAFLEKSGVKYTSFWISNQIFIAEADLALVEQLSHFGDIEEITQEEMFQLPVPQMHPSVSSPRALQWGVQKIRADEVWALPGNTDGTGAVVGGIDTGVRYTHEALRGNFRSSYGWYDPSTRTQTPTDNNGHGTHTMGTIAGADGIGVAPGAQWIACRGCAASSCSQADLTACGEFMACPTDPQGNNPDCTQAPDLVSNSWGGGQGSTAYSAVVNAWIAAGIVPLFSMGNSGPACTTANSPGDLVNAIGVGSTSENDAISSFSSKGPSIRGNIKPDISAPGGNVYSSYHTSDTAYQTLSGTSMSCPHAAGSVAIVRGVAPNLSIEEVKSVLFDNAARNLPVSGRNCGGIDETVYPNNAFGHGRIDLYNSVQALRAQNTM